MHFLKKFIRYLLYFLCGITAFILVYLFFSWLLPHFKANGSFVNASQGVEIYVKSNGVHTDIVMPVQTEIMNWNDVLPCSDFVNVDEHYEYIAMGWGDKGFYIDTPTWDDLTFTTAFKAAFGLGVTAMHVTYRYRAPKLSESCRKVVISKEQYLCLIDGIISSFAIVGGKPVLVPCKGYTKQDRFYEAKGRYTLFRTCNVWTGKTLKCAGVKVGIWTPFQGGLIDHLN